MKKLLSVSIYAIVSMLFIDMANAASCPAINRTTHPYGLHHAAFNCYTDDTWLGRNFGGDNNEQNFVRVRTSSTEWSDNVTLTNTTDRVHVLVYLHNSGVEGRYPANGVNINMNWADPANFIATITANNTNPLAVDDTTSINTNGFTLVPNIITTKSGATLGVADDTTSYDLSITDPFISSYKHASYLYLTFDVEETLPRLQVIKTDINGADIDGTMRNDTQTITQGADAVFEITVRNNDTETITNVAITDALSPSCNLTQSQAQTLITASGDGDNDFEPGESFTYTCTDSNVQASYTNTAIVTGTGVTTGDNLTDDDSTEIIIGNNGYCGDGILQAGEECDNGSQNGQAGNSCSATCTTDGGGGGAERVPTIGTCVVHSTTGSMQCVSRKPVEFGSQWTEYRQCVENNPAGFIVDNSTPGNTREQKCVYAWAQSQGFEFCGDMIGTIIDPFENNHGENAEQCNLLPPLDPGIIPRGACPGCFGAGAYIVKTSNKTHIARGDTVGYNLRLTLGLHDRINYRVLNGLVKIYDFTIPSEGGNLWGRKGITGSGFIDGPAGGIYMTKNLDSTELNAINAGGTEIEVDYTMNSALASDADTASIDNVAFAVVEYDYIKTNCDPSDPTCGRLQHQQVYIPGRTDNAQQGLEIWRNKVLTASFSSLGDTATVNIIRPFVQANNGGNLGFELQKDRTEKVTATEGSEGKYTDGIIFIDDEDVNENLFDFDGYTAIDNIDPLKSFQHEEIDKYYDNLRFNTLPVEILGQNFEKTPIQEVYFFDGSELRLNGEINLNGRNKTFIIENGDLIIGSDGLTLTNGFGAFIVRNGDIIIDKDATALDGIFIAEKGEIQSSDISRKQLQVKGALMGDLSPLLNDRWYIGRNPERKLEPNVEIEFDLRLLEDTPPAIEQFLGSDWREGIE